MFDNFNLHFFSRIASAHFVNVEEAPEKFIHQVENFVGIPHENLQMGKLNTTKNRTTVLPSNLSRLFDEEIKTLQVMLGRELHSWIQ